MPILNSLAAITLAAFFAMQPPTVFAAPAVLTVADGPAETIAPYVPRFGRSRALIAVVGENSGTVSSDFVIPYGVLTRSGLADVVSVATQPGLLKLGALLVEPDHTTAQFDARYPEGADYVVVPAVTKREDAALLVWVVAQAGKGATMVGICNGSLVLAQAGITRGHRATGHWSTHDMRLKAYPQTQWLKNTRYVADGKLITSAGITAAMPTSIALVEALGGRVRADAIAHGLGVSYWGPRHNSDAFHITVADYVVATKNSYLNATQTVAIGVTEGVDEIALALTAEAYADTLRNDVHLVGKKQTVRTRGGLQLVPDTLKSTGARFDITLSAVDSIPAGQVPDKVLKDIEERYGARTARFVVLDWEYPTSR
jgi:putative intracellular protease/amidase